MDRASPNYRLCRILDLEIYFPNPSSEAILALEFSDDLGDGDHR